MYIFYIGMNKLTRRDSGENNTQDKTSTSTLTPKVKPFRKYHLPWSPTDIILITS